MAVLHTHSRSLELHPRVHMVMLSAAALDVKRGPLRRLPPEHGYLFNHKALVKVFRGKLLDALKAQGLQPPVVLPEAWVVHCKHLDHGGAAMVYLGRYLYRGVIQEADIVRRVPPPAAAPPRSADDVARDLPPVAVPVIRQESGLKVTGSRCLLG